MLDFFVGVKSWHLIALKSTHRIFKRYINTPKSSKRRVLISAFATAAPKPRPEAPDLDTTLATALILVSCNQKNKESIGIASEYKETASQLYVCFIQPEEQKKHLDNIKSYLYSFLYYP